MNILSIAIEILKKYSLCDRCLGRFFGYLGKGLSNLERGKTIKLLITLELHRMFHEKEIDSETIKTILLNAQRVDDLKIFDITISNRFEDVQRYCYVCRNEIEKLINIFSERIIDMIKSMNINSFIIGITSANEFSEKEQTIARDFGLKYWETIKRELKREIGKKVKMFTNAKIDFENPGAIFIVNLSKNSVEIEYPSLLIYGYYWKLGRMISQNVQINRNGKRKYFLSIEDAVSYANTIFKCNGYAIHAAGREDVDVRMLGSGRPIVIEFKTPSKSISIDEIEKTLNSYSPWLRFKLKMKVNRMFISRMKNGSKFSRKVYRAIVYTHKPISIEQLNFLERFFNNRIIEQKTPTRILKRKKDKIRRRKVYHIKTTILTPQLFEVLIECDGGLYIKELISGDNGRTNPSFSEVLECSAECLMLDVLYVHEHI